jgi:hypothetical protein
MERKIDIKKYSLKRGLKTMNLVGNDYDEVQKL